MNAHETGRIPAGQFWMYELSTHRPLVWVSESAIYDCVVGDEHVPICVNRHAQRGVRGQLQ
jgi:hypothetical protein